jgi:hypothetical protein
MYSVLLEGMAPAGRSVGCERYEIIRSAGWIVMLVHYSKVRIVSWFIHSRNHCQTSIETRLCWLYKSNDFCLEACERS